MFSIRAPPVTALITLCKPVTMADNWSNKQEGTAMPVIDVQVHPFRVRAHRGESPEQIVARVDRLMLRDRKFADSSLEEAGFELLVPLTVRREELVTARPFLGLFSLTGIDAVPPR